MPDKEHVARIVGAYVKQNTLEANQLPGLIATVHAALSSVGATEPAEQPPQVPLVPAVPIRRSIQPNSITCLDCGVEKQSLRRHLMKAHGLTPDAYRERWSLKSHYPVVAPTYSARRREFAKAWGFGARRGINR
jgi:predicted transcriptional regulator